MLVSKYAISLDDTAIHFDEKIYSYSTYKKNFGLEKNMSFYYDAMRKFSQRSQPPADFKTIAKKKRNITYTAV